MTLRHQAGLDAAGQEPADLVAGVLREDEGRAAVEAMLAQASAQLAAGGWIVLSGSSTGITRLVEASQALEHLRIVDRRRRLGYSVLVLQRVSSA